MRLVLIHGSFHGPWCWDALAMHLAAAGISSSAPALPIETAGVTLTDLVGAVTPQLPTGDAEPLVLVGHSFAGMLLPQLAQELADRVTGLVYLDAFVPERGETAFELLGPFGDELRAIAASSGDMIPAPDPRQLGIVDVATAAEVATRLVAMPASTHDCPAALSATDREMPRSLYLRCTGFPGFAQHEDRARQAGWDCLRTNTGHDAMLIDPRGLAKLLLDHVLPSLNAGTN